MLDTNSKWGVVGPFTDGEEPGTTMTLEEASSLLDRTTGERGYIARGTDNPGDMVRKIAPESVVEVDIPTFHDGKISVRRQRIVTHLGGRARDEALSRKEAEAELSASLTPQAVVFNSLDPETGAQPLFLLAVAVKTAEDMRRPGFLDDIEDASARLVLAGRFDEGEAHLSPVAIKVLPGGEEFNAQGTLDITRAQLPALQQAGFKGVSVRPKHGEVNAMRQRFASQFLKMTAEEGCFGKALDTIIAALKKASVDAVRAVMAAQNDKGIFRNWAAWLQLSVAGERPVDILNLSADWLAGTTSAGTRFIGAGARLSTPPNVFVLEQFVTSPQAADQSGALRDIVLLDGVKSPQDLEPIGTIAAELRVMVHANLVCRSLEEIVSATESFGRGTADPWGQHICLYGGHLALPMGAGISLELPTAAAAAAARSALDARLIAEGEAVSGPARAPVSRDGRFLAPRRDDGRPVVGLGLPTQRDIAMDNVRVIGDLIKPGINLPVKIDGDPENLTLHRAATLFTPAQPSDATTPFQFQAPVRIRNVLLSAVDRHLRNEVLNRVIDGQLLRDVTKVLNDWLKSLDRSKRQRLIDGKASKITLKHEGGMLTAEVTIAYLPTVETVAIVHIPIQAQLEYETGQHAEETETV